MTLPDSLDLLATWLETLPEPHVLFDAQYRILAANSAYRQVFGQDASVLGRTCYAVSHHSSVPCDQAGEACPLARAQYSGQCERVLHLHHTSRGEEYVAIALQPLRTGAGPAQYFLEKMELLPLGPAQAGQAGLLGRSPAFRATLEWLARAGASNACVVLHGEPGTGKELAARAVHAASPRAEHPLVVVDCAGLPEALLESELFGQGRTGVPSRNGLLEMAQGGTLLLQDVDNLPLLLQTRLLRLLDSGTYRRVGSSELRRADVRIIATTSADLGALVRNGRWRPELYYRLNALPITLPPLRERGADVVLLADDLLQRLAPGGKRTLSAAAQQALLRHPFPGNMHELRNVLQRALLLTDGRSIGGPAMAQALALDAAPPPPPAAPSRTTLRAREAEALHQALQHTSGTRQEQARALGVSERTLYRRLRARDALHESRSQVEAADRDGLQGANRSNSGAIARICNAADGPMPQMSTAR